MKITTKPKVSQLLTSNINQVYKINTLLLVFRNKSHISRMWTTNRKT